MYLPGVNGNVKEFRKAGIEAATRAGIMPIKINMVVQGGINDHECVPMARLTMEQPVHVRFIEYMPVADYALWTRHRVSNTEVKKSVEGELGPLYALPRSEADGPALSYRFDGAVGTIGFISAITDDGFCGRCNRLRLTANGMLRPLSLLPDRDRPPHAPSLGLRR